MLALRSHVSWLACLLAHASCCFSASFVFKARFRVLACLDSCLDDAGLVERVGAAVQLPHERHRAVQEGLSWRVLSKNVAEQLPQLLSLATGGEHYAPAG